MMLCQGRSEKLIWVQSRGRYLPSTSPHYRGLNLGSFYTADAFIIIDDATSIGLAMIRVSLLLICKDFRRLPTNMRI